MGEPLTREAVKGDVLAEKAHRDEQFFGLADWAAVVLFAVQDQHRHVDVADEADRRDFPVFLGVVDRAQILTAIAGPEATG